MTQNSNLASKLPRVGFGLFCFFLFLQAIATFSEDFRKVVPLNGIRVYEGPARGLCRVLFSEKQEEGGFKSVRLASVLHTPVLRFSDPDDAVRLMVQACKEMPQAQKLRAEVSCPGESGWDETKTTEFPCNR